MKKITLWLFALFTCWQINAQVSSYGFSQSAGTYTEITGGTVLGVATNDDTNFNANPIGFNFVYNGTTYTQFSVNANGFLALGATVASSYTALSGGATNNVIAALNGDLNGNTTGELSYQLSGSAPNQVLTIQWKNYRHYNVTGDINNFQIKLYETTNVVEVVYGSFTQNATNRTRQVGLRGASATDFNNRTTTADWSATTAGGTNAASCALQTAIVPSSGLTFTWTPPSCAAPSGFVSSAITPNSATIAWNAASPVPSTGYEYYYSDVNTAPTGAGTPINTLTDNLSGLNPATTYYVWLRSDCGGTFSAWNGPFTFTTACVSVTDFVQDFEATTGAAFPVCWAKVGATGTANTQASTGISGARNLYMYSSAVASRPVVSMTPVSNANAGTHRMRMKVRGNFSAGETIEFGYLTNPSDATTFTPISSIVTNSATVAQDFVIVPTGMPAGDVVFALRTGTALLSVLIDDVNWEPIPAVAPTCSTITSPTTGAINVANSVVTWTSSTDATGYYINAGFSGPGSTDVLNLEDVGNVLSYAIPTDPGTTYHVTVIPYNAFGQATGCMEINFTTCDGLTPDVLETFATFLPSCWQEADNGDLVSGPATFGAAGWFADGFGNVGTTGSIAYEIWLASANDWIISPVVSIPATGYELKFDAAATQWNTTAAPTTPWEADDFVQVLISTTGTDNWIVLDTYNSTNVPATTGTTNIIDLDAYAGMDVRFAYRVVEGTADGGADLNFYVDNFEVRLTPALAPSCASNIVATPDAACGNFANSITWDATSGADGYFITVGTTTGGTDVANNVDLGNVLSYNFTGTIGTTYYYTILPYNGVGPATGCTEMSFTTNANGCYCTSAPSSVDGNGITNVQIVATDFPSTVTVAPFYNDFTATPVDMSQGISNNVQIAYNTGFGYTYNYAIFIDANDDYTLDASEIVATGSVSNTPAIQTVNASFVMPGTIPLGNHRMRIVTADSAFDTPNPFDPCYSGSYGETLDFTVNIIAATCTPASATATVVPACGTAQFSVDVNVTALGSGTPSITDGTTTWPVTAIGVVNVGPFADASSVTLTLLHGSDSTCDLPLGSFTYTCPAVNDDLCNAIPITVNATSTGTAYGNVGATAQANEPVPGCFSDNINGSVWFSFVAPASGEVNITTDIAGATLIDTEIAVYAASGVTCSDLSTLGADLGCDQDGGTTINYNSFLNLAGLTPSETYYIQVDDYGFGVTQGSFGLEVTEVLSSDSFDNNSFVAYPNPVKDIFNVSYSSEISSVRVMNLLGQEVITKNVGSTSTQVDMSQLSAGTYIVNVAIGETIKTIKVVKQ